MAQMTQTVRLALKDKNPALFKELQMRGGLNDFLSERTAEIQDAIVSRTMEIARWQGLTEATNPMDKAAMLKVAESLAVEEVLAEMLEFPQDETSPPSQGATTHLAATI